MCAMRLATRARCSMDGAANHGSVPACMKSPIVTPAIPHRPFKNRSRSLRHDALQEGRLHHRVPRPPHSQQGSRRSRDQIHVRAQQPLDHRRLPAPEHRALHQSLLQAECGDRRGQGQDPHHRDQDHPPGRRDHLSLRPRIFRHLHQAQRLPMRGLHREAAGGAHCRHADCGWRVSGDARARRKRKNS